MAAIVAGLALLVLAVAWLRYSDRLDGWARNTAVRLRLRRSGVMSRPGWYRIVHVWGGAAFLGTFGALLLATGIAKAF